MSRAKQGPREAKTRADVCERWGLTVCHQKCREKRLETKRSGEQEEEVDVSSTPAVLER